MTINYGTPTTAELSDTPASPSPDPETSPSDPFAAATEPAGETVITPDEPGAEAPAAEAPAAVEPAAEEATGPTLDASAELVDVIDEAEAPTEPGPPSPFDR